MSSITALRERLALNAKTKRELVTIDIGDGPITLAVRGITVGGRRTCVSQCTTTTKDEDGESVTAIDQEKMTILLVMECVRDPETDERIWGDKDFAVVEELPLTFLEPLSNAISSVNGATKTGENAAKNSDATPPATSSSN